MLTHQKHEHEFVGALKLEINNLIRECQDFGALDYLKAGVQPSFVKVYERVYNKFMQVLEHVEYVSTSMDDWSDEEITKTLISFSDEFENEVKSYQNWEDADAIEKAARICVRDRFEKFCDENWG
jgi:hypothetical protein